DGGDDLARRIHMRAVAQHDVEKDDRRLRIGRLLGDALVSQAMIDHRMRAAAGEHVVAEIDQRMRAALPDVLEPQSSADRRVGIDGRNDKAEKKRSLEAKRAAAIETADIFLLRIE